MLVRTCSLALSVSVLRL